MKLDIKGVFKELDADCVKRQGGLFEKEFEFRFEFFDKTDLSLAQARRVKSLIVHLSKGYTKRPFDYYVVFNAVKSFVKATEGKGNDEVKNTFRSFMKVPKGYTGAVTRTWERKIKGLNSNDKVRGMEWGRTAKVLEVIPPSIESEYMALLKLIERREKGKGR